MSPDDILNHFRVPGISRQCYLLLCDGAAVTVQSQQVRAFNLLYAFWNKGQIRNRTVAVIGGGAAGLTFAAGAAVLDAASVELFERYSHPMHLQSGSWHRPLHPAIYTWPADTAYRPVSHLPLLGWTTGKAHDVADQIRSKFKTVESAVNENGHKRLIIKPNVTATVDPQGIVRDGNTKRAFDLVILAVGFGAEENQFDLPWNSYWRVDPLDQSFLRQANEAPHIVVVGTGDGALIEILRSCVQTFDQGAFLDQVLVLTLEDRALRKEIAKIDKPKLLARFVQRFPNANEDGTVYRIRIWLEGVPSHLTVTYYLHVNYTEDREVPSRVGAGEDHEQWINTSRDYEIRIRTSDGFEWNVGTVANALKEEATRKGPHPRVFGKRPDGGWPDDGEAFDKAVDRLVDSAKKPLPR